MRLSHSFAAFAVGVGLASSGCASQSSKAPPEEIRPPPSSNTVKSQQATKEKVEALLAGYERVPTAEDFKVLGPEALTVLEQIYNDASQLPTKRTRAVASMALADSPDAEKKLRDIVIDSKVDSQYRSTAALALAHRAGERALTDLAPLLESKEPRLRDAAARAIGSVGSVDARKSLEERLGKETDPSVREAIQQTLTKMEP